ncbi:aminotransferase class I and II [Methanothermus fervidus DSM 2088]|uniref:Aminotransferase n=1 Tax=Methanothermus fervidus (strain ATCC 43054 / DSM 2088 / JCM 10308 / V24 S) TaxID=523846 RepID=E3GWL6_METFV|nr:aminotransferase class I and II [Methanothermus fervidus DSM 2088]
MSKKMFAKRIEKVKLSEVRKMFDLAEKKQDIINLGIGEPDFGIPPHVKDAIKDALDEDFTHYTPNLGIYELREAIARKLKKENKINTDAESIMVTAGASEALYILINIFVDNGDEVLVPDPGFLSYDACVKLAGGKTVSIPLKSEENFRVNPDVVENLITDNTKLIILNSPSNPTGNVMDKDDVKAIAEIAEDNEIFIISDEVYEKIIYEKKHYSPRKYTENAFIVNSFSKTYAMTGLRVGYFVASPEIINKALKIHQYNVACAPSISQIAALSALKGPQKYVVEMVDKFRKRRDFIVERLNEIGINCKKPEGAFYVFPYVGDELNFTKNALDAGVAVVPGRTFGKYGAGHVRISYATSLKNIEEAMNRIEKKMKR